MSVLAIDQGTSSTTALVLSDDGRVLAQHSVSVEVDSAPDGRVEFDAEALLQSVIDAGREALRLAGEPVAAVGIGNQGESVVPVSAGWRASGPGISWQDRRAASLTDGLAAQAERLQSLTGLPLDPYFTAPKLALCAPVRAVPLDAWITVRLTGSFVTDAATASRTLLMELDSGQWSSEACEIFGVDPAELPEIVSNAGPVGETTAFGGSLPLTGLCVDQQAALFAEGCLERGQTKCTYGTGAFVLAAAGSSPRRSTSGLAACVAWQLERHREYCLDGQVYTAGAAVDWLARLGVIATAAELDELCGAEPPAGDDPLFVPSLAGLGAPWWEPDARGVLEGLSLSSGRAEVARALVWGIAGQIAILVAAIEADLGSPCEVLRVDGGLTRSRSLLQAQADLLQTPVEVYPSPEATALGVAAFARLGAGLAQGPSDALAPWTPSVTVEPAIDADRAEAVLAPLREASERLAR